MQLPVRVVEEKPGELCAALASNFSLICLHTKYGLNHAFRHSLEQRS